MTKIVRAFIAHSKADSEAYLSDCVDRIKEILEKKAAGRARVEIVLGREDYEANFKAAGSWDAWTRDVVFRVDFRTREITNTLIIVTNRFVGKATAQIVGHALVVKRPVLFLDGNLVCDLVEVKGITQVSDSFQDGWRIET